MPGQARKRSTEETPLVEGEVTPETLDDMEQSAGREGEEPVIPVEMAEDDDEDDDEDADEADEDADDEDDDEDDDEEDEDEDDDEDGAEVDEPEGR